MGNFFKTENTVREEKFLERGVEYEEEIRAEEGGEKEGFSLVVEEVQPDSKAVGGFKNAP